MFNQLSEVDEELQDFSSIITQAINEDVEIAGEDADFDGMVD